MHSVKCPSCGVRVEVDFVPVAGQVWCPTCQKVFSPRPESKFGQETNDKESILSAPPGWTGRVCHRFRAEHSG